MSWAALSTRVKSRCLMMQEALSTGYFFRVSIRHCVETVHKAQATLAAGSRTVVDAARTAITCLRSQQIVAHLRYACLRFKSEGYTAQSMSQGHALADYEVDLCDELLGEAARSRWTARTCETRDTFWPGPDSVVSSQLLHHRLRIASCSSRPQCSAPQFLCILLNARR